MEGVKLSVVIVDRDVENLMKLRWLFEGCGCEKVACVETVEDALWLLRTNRVDILLCEFSQHGGGGFQVIYAIRQEFTFLQLVLYSDDDDDVVMGEMAAVRAIEVGACAFYRKSMISMEVVRHHLKIIESSSSFSCINDEIMEEMPNSEQVMKLGKKKKRKRGDDDGEMTSSSSSSGELSIRSGFINISSKRIMAAAAVASKLKKKKNTLLIMLNNNNTSAAAGSVSDHQEEAELEEMMTPPNPSANSVDSNFFIHYDYYNTVLHDWSAAAAEDESSSMPMLQDYWSDADIEELFILDNIPQLQHLGSLF